MTPPRPGGGLPPHLANLERLTELQRKVAEKYGAFGTRPEDDKATKALSDTFLKPTLQIIAGVFLASLFASFTSSPQLSAQGAWANSFRIDTTFIAIWGPLLYWVIAKPRVWKSARVYLVLALFIESFSEVMLRERGVVAVGEGGYWDTVMWPASVAFFGTIKEFAGLPGASLSVFTLVTAGLLGRAVFTKKTSGISPPPKFAKKALFVFLGSVVGLAVFGIVRGGGIEPAFRQTIHLLQLPLVALLFLYALRVPEDLAAVGSAFICVAVARALLVLFVYFGICVPSGVTQLPGKPEWCTNHSDSVLFVMALVILATHALEQRTKKVIVRSVLLAFPIILGIVFNNRRLAFVSLSAAPFVIYLALKPSRRKTKISLALALAIPLVLGYVVLGSAAASASPIWKPAKLVVSVLDQKDNSSLSRDIENENLIFTLRQNAAGLVPSGFGHEYQYSPDNPPVDLGDIFKNFRLIAHNGVLWIWSLGGVVGFTLLWMIYPLGATLALRGYRIAGSPLERSAALSALGAVAVCVVQIWGDQGFNSYMTLVTFGVSFAIAARLAVRQGT